MQKEQAKNLFREKFENIISKDSAAAAELLKYAETAVRNHRGEKFASEIQPPDFSLQDLVFMISDADVTKDHTDIIFQAFINYSPNLEDFFPFLKLLVNEKEIKLSREGLVNLFLSAKYAYLSSSSLNRCLYPHIEKILLLIVNNIADLPSVEVLLSRIQDHLIRLMQGYLAEFTSFQDLPRFLKEEVKVINELLNKNNLSLEDRNDILLGYVLMFVEDTLNEEKEALLKKGMIGEEGIVSIPVKKYGDFYREAIANVLTFPLGSLTNSNFGFSQNHLLNQNLWGQWRKEAADASKEFLRNSVKKVIPEFLAVPNKENSKTEKESKKETSVPLKIVSSAKKQISRLSANFSPTSPQSRIEIASSRTQSSRDVSSPSAFFPPQRERSKRVSTIIFEENKENLPAKSYKIPPENELEDTSAKTVIDAIEGCCKGLEKPPSGLDEVTSAVKFLEDRIQGIIKMRDYQQTLPALRKLCLKIKATFPAYKEKLADIDKECDELLKSYKDLVQNDSAICQGKGQDYKDYIYSLGDKKLLEIVCFLDPDLLIDKVAKEALSYEGIRGILIFSIRYLGIIEPAFKLVYKDQPKELGEYIEKLKGAIHGGIDGIYNTGNNPYASHFKTGKQQDSSESDPGFGSIKTLEN